MAEAPEVAAGELLKLVDGLAGRRKARILFWVVVACLGIGFAPTLVNSIKTVFKEFESVGITWPVLAGSVFLITVAVSLVCIIAAGSWLIAYAIGLGFRKGSQRKVARPSD